MRKLIIISIFLLTSISSFSQNYFTSKFWNRLTVDTIKINQWFLYRNDTVFFPTYTNARGFQYKNAADPTDLQDLITLNYFSNNALFQPLDSVAFTIPDISTIFGDYTLYRDTANNTISFKTGLGSTAQIARESLIKVYNNSGVIIPNGDIIGASGIMPGGIIAVERAIATNRYTALLWATTDIPIDGVGDAVVVYGSVRGVPVTASLGQVWLSDVDSGKVVNTPPSFPSYEYSLGAATIQDGVNGQYEARLDAIDFNNTIRNAHNGQFRETISATVSSDGATITLSLERNGGGDLTQIWSSGYADLDCTDPVCSVELTAGTDISPQENFVYIFESDPTTLIASTAGFPKGVEHIKIFDGALFTALRTQNDDGLANRNWNDHLQSPDGMGHILHISERIRQNHAEHNSGMAGTLTISGGGSIADISITGGDAYQLHLQDVDAMNTSTGSYIYVQNDFVTAWDKITDIEDILTGTGALGNSLNNTSFSIVLYTVANKSGEADQYVVTVPIGTYSKNVPQNAEDDLAQYAVYDFPKYLKGKAVLVAKFNIVNNGGALSLYSTQDLRGKIPNSTIGGGLGGGTGVSDFLSLLDTYSSYSGLAFTGLKVDVSEAGLIATQWLEDASGNFTVANNLDITGFGTLGTSGLILNGSDTLVDANAVYDFVIDSLASLVDSIYVEEIDPFPIDQLKYTLKDGSEIDVTEIYKPDGILTGGLVTWAGGLIFSTTPAAYYIAGAFYTTGTELDTLTAADGTHPRIDLLAVDTNSVVIVITGIPSATPQKPTPDPQAQIELTSILVPANATEPEPPDGGVIADTLVYDENVEWTGSSIGVSVDFASATDPYSGSICADVGTISNGDVVDFTSDSPIPADLESLSLFFKLKEDVARAFSLNVQFYLSGSPVTDEFEIPIDRGILTWQNIGLDFAGVVFSETTFDEVLFRWRKTGRLVDVDGFYLDFIKLQSGLEQPTPAASPTRLSTGTRTATSYGITSDGSVDDIILLEATTDLAGLLGADKWDEIVANSLKETNATHTGEVTGATALTVVDGVIDEPNLDVSNSPTDNYVLSYNLAGTNFTWIPDNTGANQDLSYNTGTHTVEITSGSDAIIPLAIDDGATEGLASFTAADFNATAGNIAIDYVNGQKADTDQPGFLTDTDWDSFNDKVTMTYPSGSGVAVVSSGTSWGTTLVNTTIGTNVLTSTNPGAIRFARANADNTFSWLNDSDFRTAINVDIAGTDNSIDVTLNASATTGGLSLSTQEIGFRAATNAQTGYATAAQITAIEANTTKLSGIEVGAEVNVNADWDAVSGDAEILNKPTTLPTSSTWQDVLDNGTGVSTTAIRVPIVEITGRQTSLNSDGSVTWGSGSSSGTLSWDTDIAYIRAASGNNLDFGANGQAVNKMRLSINYNLLIGTSTDNLTDKLQVNGTAMSTGWYLNDANTGISEVSSELTLFDAVAGSYTLTQLVSGGVTDLSLGTVTSTTMDVNSSSGDNMTLIAADTDDAGLLTAAKFDEIVANNSKVTNASHTGEVTGATALTIASDVVDYDNLDETLKQSVVENGDTWDFSGSGVIVAARSANVTLIFDNKTVNKYLAVKLTLSSSAVITWPAEAIILDGSATLEDGIFYIYLHCVATDEVTVSITKEAT